MMTTPIRTVDVKPNIPEELNALHELSRNLWFVWNPDCEELFRRINPDLWEMTRKNPVAFLSHLHQKELQDLCRDEGFIAHLERVKREFDRYLTEDPNPEMCGERERQFLVAYFTAECGVAECLPIYSGGLGILSGDHMKSASDLKLPIIAITLAYQKGYFRQYLTQDGWQMETYPLNQFTTMPMKLVLDGQGEPVKTSIHLKSEEVHIQAWQVNIGRSRLFLLDSNLKENPEWARGVTSELYGGDREMRFFQEIILGIGGVRMLGAMELTPSVYHMNEGHSSFAIFERIRQLRANQGLSFNEALEFVRATNVFTTHTPVAAGIDTFHPDLMKSFFDAFAKEIGISFDVLMSIGRQDPRNRQEEFCLTVAALKLSAFNNAVSRLHGQVSRKMWQNIWPKTPELDLPITHITNGVHIPSWISSGTAENYDRYLGPRWIEDPDNEKIWERVDKIPDTELWRTRDRGRARLVAFSRRRLKEQLAKRGGSNRDISVAENVLNSETLTIGFARRFAPYKRAYLLLQDIERLERILTSEERPVQIIFAGKAHPQDQMGKDMIKQLVQVSNREQLRRYMVFLENYDLEIARHMVQGVDVWLNTPRRPLEACGTSGMKAVANGALHFSILDGWWEEGYDREIGWTIGSGEVYDDHDFQDELENKALYDILEKDIIPLFYDRSPDGLPRHWLAMVKASLHKLCPRFNTHRMVEEYWERFYVPASKQGLELSKENWNGLKGVAQWREKIMYNWSNVEIKDIRTNEVTELEAGSVYHVEADIFLGELSPEDVMVEVYCGRLDPNDRYIDRFTQIMEPTEPVGDHMFRYQKDVRFDEAGHFGLNVRLLPNHPNPEARHSMGLVIWGSS